MKDEIVNYNPDNVLSKMILMLGSLKLYKQNLWSKPLINVDENSINIDNINLNYGQLHCFAHDFTISQKITLQNQNKSDFFMTSHGI